MDTQWYDVYATGPKTPQEVSLWLRQNWLIFDYVACLKIRFFLLKDLITYRAYYATSQKCALMHDAMAYVYDIQTMNTGFITKICS